MANQGRPPVYCNTCVEFPINKVDENGQAKCRPREEMHRWDNPACVLFTAVSPSERERRRHIVVQLHKAQQEAAA